jgi:hypothetical protein
MVQLPVYMAEVDPVSTDRDTSVSHFAICMLFLRPVSQPGYRSCAVALHFTKYTGAVRKPAREGHSTCIGPRGPSRGLGCCLFLVFFK